MPAIVISTRALPAEPPSINDIRFDSDKRMDIINYGFKILLSNIGCNIGGVFYDILAFADDLVLLASSWKTLQDLIDVLNCYARDMDMICNIDKTVCMVLVLNVVE